MRKVFTFIVLPVLALSAACGSSTSTPSPASPTSALDATSAATGLANADVPIFQVDAAGQSPSGKGPCVFNPATGEFDCPEVTRDGLTLTRQFTLYDAGGNVQSKFDKNTTASIKTETTAKGTITLPDGSTSTIDRSGVMITTGLVGDETTHTLNGTEQGTVVTTSNKAGGATINTTLNDSTNNLVVPVPDRSTQGGYPLSGSQTHSTTTTVTHGSDTRTTVTERRETFNGTNIVQVDLTVNGATEHCTRDLATHTSTCSRK